MSPGVVMFPCVTGPALSGLGHGGEASGQGGARPTEDLEPGATWRQGLRVSPDGGAAWHRCTHTCLPCLGRTGLRLVFPVCLLKQRGHREKKEKKAK